MLPKIFLCLLYSSFFITSVFCCFFCFCFSFYSFLFFFLLLKFGFCWIFLSPFSFHCFLKISFNSPFLSVCLSLSLSLIFYSCFSFHLTHWLINTFQIRGKEHCLLRIKVMLSVYIFSYIPSFHSDHFIHSASPIMHLAPCWGALIPVQINLQGMNQELCSLEV